MCPELTVWLKHASKVPLLAERWLLGVTVSDMDMVLLGVDKNEQLVGVVELDSTCPWTDSNMLISDSYIQARKSCQRMSNISWKCPCFYQ